MNLDNWKPELETKKAPQGWLVAHFSMIIVAHFCLTKHNEEFLLALLEEEVRQRDTNVIRERIRRAGFPEVKTLDTFDFTAIPTLNKPKVLALGTCEFIRRKENALLLGSPGAGKTHVATALGVAACRSGYKVKYWRTSTLVNELLVAQQEHRLGKFEKLFLRPHLLFWTSSGSSPCERPQSCCSSFSLLATKLGA